MTNMEEVSSAEARMNTAKELLRYIETRKPIDHDQRCRLVARVKRTEAEFAQAVKELDR